MQIKEVLSGRGGNGRSGSVCVCVDRLGRQEHTRDCSPEISFQSFSAGSPCEQFWHVQGCTFYGVHPAFSLTATASPILLRALMNGFGEAVVACDMPELCKFRLFTVARRGSCGPTRKLSCSAHCHWYCALSRRYGES